LFEPIPQTLEAPFGLRPAAVLVPVVGAGPLAEGTLLYTVRTENLAHHRGQISFPGGAIEPGESPAAAALREAAEEIGLNRGDVELLGALNPVLSPAGYWVLPVVGRIPARPALKANPAEVARILWVPVGELLAAPAWPEWRRGRYVWHYPWRGYDIWGVTGNITHDFLAHLKGGEG
jgi:8-oxo-dGTP pyrophosphatase MutT (NUDIX family)